MKSHSGIQIISTICFAVTFGAYQSVHKLTQELYPNSSILLNILEFGASVGLFTVMFQLLFLIYNKFSNKIVNRHYDIAGEWYQVLAVEGKGSLDERVRYGKCKILFSLQDFTFSAENYKYNDKKLSSTWQSESYILHESKLTVMYLSEGFDRVHNIRRGTIVFNLYGTPPTMLVGKFSDSAPANTSGEIRLFRTKEDNDKYLNHLINN